MRVRGGALGTEAGRGGRVSRPRPHRIPESVVQRHIVALIRNVGGEVWEAGTKRSRKDHHMGTRQTPGIPDVMAFLPPRTRQRWVLLFVEAKASGGRLRPEQARFRELCQWADVAHVVGDLDAVIAWMLAEGYLKRDQVAHYRLPAEMRADG